ncbi:MAG TPA: protein translocase subunit SecDF [Flavilitoribacter sp.]|nr:protein translocase subunit SecDF [Flavilitoribacter sp.]
MQGKGVVRFFLFAMAVMAVIQGVFMLKSSAVEKKAAAYAKTASSGIADETEQDSVYKAKLAGYLDSVSTETVFRIPLIKSYTYQELKEQQINLGLDLKGGMSVVLQVDLKEFIRSLAKNSKDPTFNQALDAAAAAQANTQSDFVTLFADAWSNIAGDKKLAPIFILNPGLRSEIDNNSSDSDVIAVLKRKAGETVDLSFDLLKKRIDKMGVIQPNVTKDPDRDLILVELPGIDNPERARHFLSATAQLDFRNVYRVSDPEILPNFSAANELLAKTEGVDLEPTISRIDTVPQRDSTGNIIPGSVASYDTIYDNSAARGPLFSILTVTNGSYGRAVMGVAEKNKRDQVLSYLRRDDVKSLFPEDVVWAFSRDAIVNPTDNKSTNLYELYALKSERDGSAPLTGENVSNASPQPDPQTNKVSVSLTMDNEGARTWSRMTTAAAQDQNREIAIVLDGEVASAPQVINPITGGVSSITGNFSIQDATDLANILQVGRLPAAMKSIQENLVGPSLGKQNIRDSVLALLIGFIIVMAFMIIYYGKGGVVSVISLLLNVVFIFTALASFGTVLTLPGIAGIVLTIGMAVDANVIIYERIREELREGKALTSAVTDGFKHSYSAIIDANVTTLLTAIVLNYFGLGPIKGFAIVLIIGVISSLFTAVLVTRLIIDWWLKKGRSINFDTGWSKNVMSNLNVNWMGMRKAAYSVSGAIILMGIVSFFIRGFDLGVDFKGGYSYNLTIDSSVPVDAEQLRISLTTAFEGSAPVVKAVDVSNTFNVVTDYLIDQDQVNGTPAEDLVMQKLFDGVKSIVAGDLTVEHFKNPDFTGTHVTSFTKVGPTIADDIQRSAFEAGIFALLLIFLYIFIRFSKWQYSLGAVIALFHDTLITLGIFSMFHGILPFTMEVDQAFIAAILTVIGYSINDTVIVFDRIREYLNTYTKRDKIETINMAINSTLSRTTITSMTTLFVVLVLFIFGGASIKGFAFAILVGILVGTYSSIFIATPVMADLSGDLEAKEVKKKETKKSFSRATQTTR